MLDNHVLCMRTQPGHKKIKASAQQLVELLKAEGREAEAEFAAARYLY